MFETFDQEVLPPTLSVLEGSAVVINDGGNSYLKIGDGATGRSCVNTTSSYPRTGDLVVAMRGWANAGGYADFWAAFYESLGTACNPINGYRFDVNPIPSDASYDYVHKVVGGSYSTLGTADRSVLGDQWFDVAYHLMADGTLRLVVNGVPTIVSSDSQFADLWFNLRSWGEIRMDDFRICTGATAIEDCLLDNECGTSPIEFAGLSWDVSCYTGGPGYGCFSSNEDSVWVEDPGSSNERLHLKIRQLTDGRWCQAEVAARPHTSYFDHRFELTAGPWEFDENVVIGLFLFREYPAIAGSCVENECHFDERTGTCVCELDVEITGSTLFPSDCSNGQCPRGAPPYLDKNVYYIAQPFNSDVDNCWCGQFDISSTGSTHVIGWQPDSVVWQSWEGHCQTRPCPGTSWPSSSWTYVGDHLFSDAVAARVIVNLWTYAPGPESEIVIENVVGSSAGIYSDGFEFGTTSAWSTALPR